MLAAEDIRLTYETIQELQAQGQGERAKALEAVLAVATSALAGQWPPGAREYLTTGEAGRALGVSIQTIKNWASSGKIQVVRLGGCTLVHREVLLAYLARLQEGRPERADQISEDAKERQERRRFVQEGLPGDRLVRLDAVHQKMENGQPLSKAERSEMVALEREITSAAGRRLERWTRQRRAAAP